MVNKLRSYFQGTIKFGKTCLPSANGRQIREISVKILEGKLNKKNKGLTYIETNKAVIWVVFPLTKVLLYHESNALQVAEMRTIVGYKNSH